MTLRGQLLRRVLGIAFVAAITLGVLLPMLSLDPGGAAARGWMAPAGGGQQDVICTTTATATVTVTNTATTTLTAPATLTNTTIATVTSPTTLTNTTTATVTSPTTITSTSTTAVQTTITETATTTDSTTTTLALTTTTTTTTGTETITETVTTTTTDFGNILTAAAETTTTSTANCTTSAVASPSPSATPSYTTVLTVTGPGGVAPGAGSYTSPAGSTQTYTGTPNSGAVLLGWTIDGQFAGFGNPLALPVTKNRTVVAAFAPIPQFCDIATSTPNYTAIANLAARGVILGSDNPNGPGKCFRPDDILLRIHVAGMDTRAFGWAAEDHGNLFTDKGTVDNDLWRNAGTLAFYNVARGYEDNTYRPLEPVLHAQAVAFVSRAMIRKGYWALLEDNAAYYPGVPPASGHRQDAVTYYTNAGNIPGTSAPTDPWDGPTGYTAPSTRSYFAQVLWQAYSSYFSTNRIP